MVKYCAPALNQGHVPDRVVTILLTALMEMVAQICVKLMFQFMFIMKISYWRIVSLDVW